MFSKLSHEVGLDNDGGVSGLVAVTMSHTAALATIHAASFAADAAWSQGFLRGQLAVPGTFGWIDPGGGFVLARAVADEAEILTLAVLPEVRRSGIGRKLVAAAMTEAGKRGARRLLLEVADANLAARGLYAAAGFRTLALRRGYYAPGADALVLARAIAA